MIDVQALKLFINDMLTGAIQHHEAQKPNGTYINRKPITFGSIVETVAGSFTLDDATAYMACHKVLEGRTDVELRKGKNGGVCSVVRLNAERLAATKAADEAAEAQRVADKEWEAGAEKREAAEKVLKAKRDKAANRKALLEALSGEGPSVINSPNPQPESKKLAG